MGKEPNLIINKACVPFPLTFVLIKLVLFTFHSSFYSIISEIDAPLLLIKLNKTMKNEACLFNLSKRSEGSVLFRSQRAQIKHASLISLVLCFNLALYSLHIITPTL